MYGCNLVRQSALPFGDSIKAIEIGEFTKLAGKVSTVVFAIVIIRLLFF